MRAPESVIQRGFTAGELAPVLHARADSAKYTDGLRTCRNFLVMRHGAVSNRAGFRFIGECKTTNANVRLQRFVVPEAPNASILVEVGIGYLRFYKNGALIEVSGVAAWDIATPYVVGDLVEDAGVNYYAVQAGTGNAPPDAAFWYPLVGDIFEIPTTYTTGGLIGGWEQNGNVVLITHRLHDPRELVYGGDTTWVLRLADTKPSIATPAGLALTNIPGALPYAYIVTARKDDTYEESLPSASDDSGAPMAAPTAAAPHVLAWTAVPGAAEYNVYVDPNGNGIFGYIGAAASNSFNNPGRDPDFNVTPPIDRTPFVSATTRPHVATHYQQRRFYAGSTATPQRVEGSRVGFVNNFGISSPLQDDDAISFELAGRDSHTVRHLLGLKTLLVFTDCGGWVVGEPRTALTPSHIPADQDLYVGAAADVPPVVVGNAAIYLQSRGSKVCDAQFNEEVQGLGGRDLTLFASHLFDGHTIDRMDYAYAPHSIIWCVRDDGVLLGLTYIREHDIWGWHRHDTDGEFEQVCTVPESAEDAVYVIVKRTIGGVNKRYIERLESREIREGFHNADSFFVDSGLSYSGAPATTFAGLNHLEGEVVAILADGVVVSDGRGVSTRYPIVYTVTGGAVTIPNAAANVHIGLNISRAQIETLDLDAHGTMIRDKAKRTGSVTLLVDRSARSFYAGPDEATMTPYELGLTDPAGTEFTGQLEMSVGADYSKPGRVLIWQTDPLPITILGIVPNQILGG